MSTRRKILSGLLIIPAAIGIAAMVSPGGGLELAFLILGVPILALNAWEFLSPELQDQTQSTINKDQEKDNREQGSIMSNRNLLILAVTAVIAIGLFLGFAAVKATVADVTFSYEVSTLIYSIARNFWNFISTPVVFIGLLFFLLAISALWMLRSKILGKGNGKDPGKVVKFPETFSLPSLTSITAGDLKKKTKEPWNGDQLDLKTIQLLLEIDGIDLKKPYLFSKVKTLEIEGEALPAETETLQKDAYYQGIMEGLCAYVLPRLCVIERKDDHINVRFTLKEGMRQKLLERLHEVGEESAPATTDGNSG